MRICELKQKEVINICTCRTLGCPVDVEFNCETGWTRFMKKNIFTKDNLMFFIILNLGLIFTAVGIAIFKTPNHFAFGGTSGLSIILSTLFPKWNVGAFMWIVNAALVVLGFFFLGIRSMGWTVWNCCFPEESCS